jgi:hypothetical protein
MTLSNSNDVPRKGPRDFVVDNAATCGHISTRREHFSNLDEYPVDKRPTIGGIGPQRVQIHGRGDIKIKGANGKAIVLQKASYVPDATANIFAVSSALRALNNGQSGDAEHRERARSTKVIDGNGTTILTSTMRGGLYYLDLHQDQDFL